MSSPLLCFRTITRIGLFRQAVVAGEKVLLPIAIAVPPESISIDPGSSIEEPKELACDGRMVPSFSYEKESSPSLDISFGMAVSEVESLIHGKIVGNPTGGSVSGMVFAEIKPDPNSATPLEVPARTSGQVGANITAAEAANANVYTIDPATKRASKVNTGATVGAGLSVALTQAAVDAENTIYIWCPATFTAATVITAESLGLISVFAAGVNFNNTARIISARNCSRLTGGSLSSESKRDVKLRILPDPADGNGLGYQMIDTNLQMVC